MSLQVIQSTYITTFLTAFLCWASQEVLERKFGMSPAIRRSASLHEDAATAVNPQKKHEIVRRLTKQLDPKGRFRIQTRGTIWYIKGTWCILTWGLSLTALLWNENWFVDHFIKLDPSSAVYLPYSHITASLLALYSWEMATNRYAKLNWSVIVHHWFTAIACLGILLGNFNPFATWYGWTTVQTMFPVWFAVALRQTFASKYPGLTRKSFTFGFWWNFMIIVINMSGQMFLLVNSIITGRIPIWNILMVIVAMCGWMYDDVIVLRALYSFSKQNYEDGDLTHRKLSARNLGGGSLFAKSILIDMEELDDLVKNLEDSVSKMNNNTALPDGTSAAEANNQTTGSGAGASGRVHHSPSKTAQTEQNGGHNSIAPKGVIAPRKINTDIFAPRTRKKAGSPHSLSGPLTPPHPPVLPSVGASQGMSQTPYTVTDSDVELVKHGSIESRDLRKIASRYNKAGTFHSSTNKGELVGVPINDPISGSDPEDDGLVSRKATMSLDESNNRLEKSLSQRRREPELISKMLVTVAERDSPKRNAKWRPRRTLKNRTETDVDVDGDGTEIDALNVEDIQMQQPNMSQVASGTASIDENNVLK